MYIHKYISKLLITVLITITCSAILYLGASWSMQYYFKTKYIPLAQKSSAEPVKGKILINWFRGIGEQETIARLKIAARKLGWDPRVVQTPSRFYIRWFVENPTETAINLFKPDFILTIQDWLPHFSQAPNYMTLTLGTDKYLKQENNSYYFINSNHEQFDMLLPSFLHIDQLQTAVENTGKIYNGFHWYPTANENNYTPAQPKKLFYSGGYLWDPKRSSDAYKQIFTKLDQKGYFEVCGPKKKWLHTPNSIRDIIPIDGFSLINEQHKAGISLVMHSQSHLDGGAPTGRIFEASAANTVIISDNHPFVKKHFGDNILYINVSSDQTAEDIFQQIDQHMQWIFANPELAQEKANNCHEIFLENFTMEEQLKKLFSKHHTLGTHQKYT